MTDLEQSWKLYKLLSHVYKWTAGLDFDLRQKVHVNVLDFVVMQFSPRLVWLFVKHRRWMVSDEYAMLQKRFIGFGPIYVAKTKALFSWGLEDDVVLNAATYEVSLEGEFYLVLLASVGQDQTLTPRSRPGFVGQRLLSGLIYMAGVMPTPPPSWTNTI